MVDAVIDEQTGHRIRTATTGSRMGVLQFLRVHSTKIIAAVPREPGQVGYPSQLVPPARQPASYQEIEEQYRPAGVRRRLAPPDDHAYPHVDDPRPRGRRYRVPGRQGAQDDLRRGHGCRRSRRGRGQVPAQRRSAPRRAARGQRPGSTAVDRDGWRQLDDRQRTRYRDVRPHRERARRPPVCR